MYKEKYVMIIKPDWIFFIIFWCVSLGKFCYFWSSWFLNAFTEMFSLRSWHADPKEFPSFSLKWPFWWSSKVGDEDHRPNHDVRWKCKNYISAGVTQLANFVWHLFCVWGDQRTHVEVSFLFPPWGSQGPIPVGITYWAILSVQMTDSEWSLLSPQA